MILTVLSNHLIGIVHGLGAALACAALFFAAGVALLPDTWRRRHAGFGASMVVGAAAFVLFCWLSVRLSVPVKFAIPAFAALTIVMAAVRQRVVSAVLADRTVIGRSAAGSALVFALLWVIAYVALTPPVSSEFLPLGGFANLDVFNYVDITAYVLRLGPATAPGFTGLNHMFYQVPGVYFLVGLMSQFYGQEVLYAATPALITAVALLGMASAAAARLIFSFTRTAAVGIAALIICGPFVQYVACKYFLSSIISAPVLIHLLLQTARMKEQGKRAELANVVMFAAHYALLYFLYPVFYFVGIGVQLAAIALMDLMAPRVEGAPPLPGRGTLRSMAAAIVAASLVALCAPLQTVWTARMLTSLSLSTEAGWPLDLVSPLAMFGVPGSRVAVHDGASVYWAVLWYSLVGLGGMWFAVRSRRLLASPGERTFVFLSSAAVLSYCAYYLVVGISYRQWKFASYCWMPFAFGIYSAGLRAWHPLAERLRRAQPPLRASTARLIAVLAVAVAVGSNVVAGVKGDAPNVKYAARYRNLAMVDRLQGFRRIWFQVDRYEGSALAAYYIRSKTLDWVDAAFGLPFDKIRRDWPLFIWDFGCEGVGHDDCIAVPEVGSLLLAPPSLSLGSTYSFSRSFMFIKPIGLGRREPWGRASIRRTIQIELMADGRRANLDGPVYLNLRLAPRQAEASRPQRLQWSWGASHGADARLEGQEWMSLPLESRDWTGERIKRITVTLALPDAVPLSSVDRTTQDPAPVAVVFEEMSVTAAPGGRVLQTRGVR